MDEGHSDSNFDVTGDKNDLDYLFQGPYKRIIVEIGKTFASDCSQMNVKEVIQLLLQLAIHHHIAEDVDTGQVSTPPVL